MHPDFHFPPEAVLQLPFGEGAVERVIDQIRSVDPDFNHFSVFAIRQDPEREKYPSLDELPMPDSQLRPPIELPMPPLQIEPNSVPEQFKLIDYSTAHGINAFLQSLHHSIHGGANFYTYALVVIFQPGYNMAAKPAGVLPRRLFSGAPHVTSGCLLAASGHRLALFNAQCAAHYLRIIRSRVYGIASTVRNVQAVGTRSLFPYLDAPRHTFDRFLPSNIHVGPPDSESNDWLGRVVQGGVAIPSMPHRVFDGARLNEFVKLVYRHYFEWLNAGIEYRCHAGDPHVYRFGRNHSYMQSRYPRLRDWMNYAIRSSATPVEPSWKCRRTPVEDSVPFEPLADCVIPEPEPVDEHPMDEHLHVPNHLYFVACDATIYLNMFFMHDGPPKNRSYQQIEAEIDDLLVKQGFLRALLTAIGDTECREVEIAARTET